MTVFGSHTLGHMFYLYIFTVNGTHACNNLLILFMVDCCNIYIVFPLCNAFLFVLKIPVVMCRVLNRAQIKVNSNFCQTDKTNNNNNYSNNNGICKALSLVDWTIIVHMYAKTVNG